METTKFDMAAWTMTVDGSNYGWQLDLEDWKQERAQKGWDVIDQKESIIKDGRQLIEITLRRRQTIALIPHGKVFISGGRVIRVETGQGQSPQLRQAIQDGTAEEVIEELKKTGWRPVDSQPVGEQHADYVIQIIQDMPTAPKNAPE